MQDWVLRLGMGLTMKQIKLDLSSGNKILSKESYFISLFVAKLYCIFLALIKRVVMTVNSASHTFFSRP